MDPIFESTRRTSSGSIRSTDVIDSIGSPTIGKCFKQLVALSIEELEDHETTKSPFARAMAYPIGQIEKIFADFHNHVFCPQVCKGYLAPTYE